MACFAWFIVTALTPESRITDYKHGIDNRGVPSPNRVKSCTAGDSECTRHRLLTAGSAPAPAHAVRVAGHTGAARGKQTLGVVSDSQTLATRSSRTTRRRTCPEPVQVTSRDYVRERRGYRCHLVVSDAEATHPDRDATGVDRVWPTSGHRAGASGRSAA